MVAADFFTTEGQASAGAVALRTRRDLASDLDTEQRPVSEGMSAARDRALLNTRDMPPVRNAPPVGLANLWPVLSHCWIGDA